MPASQSAMASPKLQAPVRRFEQYEAAVQAMAGYEGALRENALRMRSNGLTVTDQDQPAEVFCLLRSEEHTSELQSLRHLACRLPRAKPRPRGPRTPGSLKVAQGTCASNKHQQY